MFEIRVVLLALVVALTGLGAAPRPASGPDVTLLDLIETELGYSSIEDQYYKLVPPQTLLDGARSGMIAYLRSRHIPNPWIDVMHAQRDGRGAVPAIERQLGIAIQRYGARVEIRPFVYAAIRGEAAALHDPYTVFFTKEEVKKFSNALDGVPFGGIGIVAVRNEGNDAWIVDQVFDGAPAAIAGLQAGDRIASIDGNPAGPLSLDDFLKALRGAAGSSVALGVVRADAAVDYELLRADVTPPDVRARMLPGNIGYVALRTFGPKAGDQVRAAVKKLQAAGARAFVFDLRNNGGGYEAASVHVASVFIAKGPIVAMQIRRGRRFMQEADGSALPPRPLVVLVNHDSASGSELVAGALQDRGAGKVVGVATFGKGVVQTMLPLPDGSALKLTTARYFTPGGRDIDGVGIVPDVVVEQPAGSLLGTPGRDPQLDRALVLLTP